jgi:serine/threonine protein kinase
VTIGIQMVERLETMHNCGLVHNDLKPQNIMAHFKQNNVIIIDFGLSLNQNGSIRNDTVEYSFKGTPFFASNN